MVTQTYMREVVLTTVDSYTKCTGGGDGTTLQDIVVPDWAKSIKHVEIGLGQDGAAGSDTFQVSLRGATQYGDQILAMGAATNIGTTVALAQARMARDVDIPVIPGKSLEIWGCMSGDDPGSSEFQVEVTFSDKPGSHAYITRQADLATVDVWQTLNTENGATAVNDPIVQGRMIDQVWAAVGLKPTTQEPHQVAFRLQGIGGSIFGNEHTFTTSSNLVSDGTLADACLDPGVVKDVEIPVTKGGFRIQGVDSSASSTADPMLVVTVCFQM